MGVNIKRLEDRVVLESTGELQGGVFDLRDSPDLLPAVAVLGLKASSPVTIKNVEHTRVKESDRIASMASELRKIGARVEEKLDSLTVYPLKRPLKTVLDSHEDHRVFMALAVASAAFKGVFGVKDSGCYKKSYPSFIEDLSNLGVEIY
jgi:3-phosphoshikimate 1-carboxyvinyltransferase